MGERRGLSVIILRPIIARVAAIGADGEALRRALGIDANTSDDTFVPGERVARCLNEAASGGGAAFTLALVAGAPVGSFGLFDYLFMASRTPREAIRRMARFYALASQLVTLHLDEEADVAIMSHRLMPGITRVPAVTEFAFAAVIERMRFASGSVVPLRRVRFTHRIADPSPFQKFFGAPVELEQPRDELQFDRAALDVPFPTWDLTTAAFLQAQAERFLHHQVGRASAETALMTRLRDVIGETLRDGVIPIDDLARKVGRSKRTLQRELRSNHTSHRDLVTDVRRCRALELLARKDVSLIEVALELGFADQASFQRAFKRWTGKTPGGFRRAR